MADVFISYETDSSKEIAAKISAALEKISISCWYASRDMTPGYYASNIESEIKNCRVFVIILNKDSMQSDNVYNELHIACSRYKKHEAITLIPFKTDHSTIEGKFQFDLAGLHVVDGKLSTGRLPQPKLQNLVKLVNSALKQEAIPTPPIPSKPPRWIYFAFVCLILAVLAVALWHTINKDSTDPLASEEYPIESNNDTAFLDSPDPKEYPIKLYNSSIPEHSLLKGDGFALRGLIRSENCPLSEITAEIRDDLGHVVEPYNQKWDKNEYMIESDGMNDALVFGTLDAGNYTFILSASNKYNKNVTIIQRSFKIVSWEPPMDIVGEDFPTGVVQKGPYDLRGYVLSSYPIIRISASVENDAYPGVPLIDFKYDAYPMKTRYNLFSDGMNNVFKFGNLEPGSYTFKICATDELDRMIERESHFIIS